MSKRNQEHLARTIDDAYRLHNAEGAAHAVNASVANALNDHESRLDRIEALHSDARQPIVPSAEYWRVRCEAEERALAAAQTRIAELEFDLRLSQSNENSAERRVAFWRTKAENLENAAIVTRTFLGSTPPEVSGAMAEVLASTEA
jgi:hypothetical protein